MREFFEKLFAKEISKLLDQAQKYKISIFVTLVGLAVFYLYFRYPRVLAPVMTLEVGWVISLVWLIAITVYLYRKENVVNENILKEDFRKGLDRWEFYGDWRCERDEDDYILSVTNSGEGGIVKHCRLWNDYIFEFETKIVHSNTTWVIRARDILNYVMLQCGRAEIIPYFKVNGFWLTLPSVPLLTTLPLNEWFAVRIKVSGIKILVQVTINGQKHTLLDQELLRPGIFQGEVRTLEGDEKPTNIAVSYPLGSVGFREYGDERAYFRNVRVTKLIL